MQTRGIYHFPGKIFFFFFFLVRTRKKGYRARTAEFTFRLKRILLQTNVKVLQLGRVSFVSLGERKTNDWGWIETIGVNKSEEERVGKIRINGASVRRSTNGHGRKSREAFDAVPKGSIYVGLPCTGNECLARMRYGLISRGSWKPARMYMGVSNFGSQGRGRCNAA